MRKLQRVHCERGKKKKNREREEIVLRIEKMKSNIFNKKTIMMYHTLFYNCPV